jgi:predicted nucleotidyltransferase
MPHTYLDYPRLAAVWDYIDYVRDLDVLLVVLFGSVARGEFHPESDVDVLVLVDKPLEWKQVYQHTSGIVQPIVKTVEEYIAQTREGEPFMLEIIEDGIPLYDADRWHRRLVDEVRAAKEKWGLVRTELGWQWTKAPAEAGSSST